MKQVGMLLKKFVVYLLISVGLTIYSSLTYMIKGNSLVLRAFLFAMYMTLLAFAVFNPILLGIVCLVYIAIEALLTIDMIIS